MCSSLKHNGCNEHCMNRGWASPQTVTQSWGLAAQDCEHGSCEKAQLYYGRELLSGAVLAGIGSVLETFWFRLRDKPTKSFPLLRQEDRFGNNCILGRFGSPLGL